MRSMRFSTWSALVLLWGSLVLKSSGSREEDDEQPETTPDGRRLVQVSARPALLQLSPEAHIARSNRSEHSSANATGAARRTDRKRRRESATSLSQESQTSQQKWARVFASLKELYAAADHAHNILLSRQQKSVNSTNSFSSSDSA
mmetsp:Transcript_97057/g.182546  ORF Transcript_97057/g.182546 Transcript_97057/m.182546 type:complete len:146 (+) Transcript_97057:75-512(+)